MREVPGTRHPRVKVLAALLLLSGCDIMFKLKTVDVPVDGPPCGTPDEDGDCIADDADNCPGISNAQQTVTLEAETPAGAGDACDPDVTRTGNAIAHFEGFNDPVAAAEAWFNQFGGGWTFVEGMAQNAGGGNYGYLRRVVVDDAPDLAVEARFVFHGMVTTVVDTRISVLIDHSATDIGGQTCWVDPAQQRVYVQDKPEGTTPGNALATDIPALAPGAEILLRLRRDRAANELHCTVEIDGARTTVPVLSASGTWQTMHHVAVQARDVVADLTHITMYTR